LGLKHTEGNLLLAVVPDPDGFCLDLQEIFAKKWLIKFIYVLKRYRVYFHVFFIRQTFGCTKRLQISLFVCLGYGSDNKMVRIRQNPDPDPEHFSRGAKSIGQIIIKYSAEIIMELILYVDIVKTYEVSQFQKVIRNFYFTFSV
jgi:hypothetical protein